MTPSGNGGSKKSAKKLESKLEKKLVGVRSWPVTLIWYDKQIFDSDGHKLVRPRDGTMTLRGSIAGQWAGAQPGYEVCPFIMVSRQSERRGF